MLACAWSCSSAPALGGEVEFAELLGEKHADCQARARCTPAPDTRPDVLCGGFAAELYLYRASLLTPVKGRARDD